MISTIKCCISCILPCGAFDVIRIVHTNGHVEEISGRITIQATEVMKHHPNHVLKYPSSSSSSSSESGRIDCPKIVIVPPDAELQRGKIYFLMPVPCSSSSTTTEKRSSTATKKITRRDQCVMSSSSNQTNNMAVVPNKLLVSDQYLAEILSEKVSNQRDRRRGRTGVWRPHLQSISESPISA